MGHPPEFLFLPYKLNVSWKRAVECQTGRTWFAVESVAYKKSEGGGSWQELPR